jgi:hypothetical protein
MELDVDYGMILNGNEMKIRYSTRIVFLIGSKAYKFPISYRGWLQGKNEKEVWELYKDTGILAPLIWERFGIVCQERCQPISHTVFLMEKVTEAKSLIPRFNISNCDLYNKENWGKYKNKFVLLDYGIDERISNMY